MDEYYQVYGKVPPHPLLPTSTMTALPTVTHSPPEFDHITALGQRTLWVVFALMLLSTIGFIVLSWRVIIPKRLFYQLTTYITVIATLSYYAMATGSGWSFRPFWHTDEHKHGIPDTHKVVFRQIFYARYIDWLLTTPLLLLDLSLLAGLSGSAIANVVTADVVMILTGLFAAYSRDKVQWGWYAMGWVAFVVVIWNLATHARVNAHKRGVQKLFGPLALYLIIVWTCYPIIWGVSDLSHRLSPNAEVIAYAILDVLAKPVFGLWLLFAHQRLTAGHLNLDGVWSEGFGHREGILRVGDDEDT